MINKKRKLTVNFNDIAKVQRMESPGEFASDILITMKDGEYLRIGWNFFKNKEFTLLLNKLEAALSGK